MEKINGGTLESFIRNRKQALNEKSGSKKLGIKKVDSMLSSGTSSEQSPTVVPSPKPLVICEETASSITKDICNGLNQIHKKNFIHRDMKPENILIQDNGHESYTAKIADFGLSAEVHANVFHG